MNNESAFTRIDALVVVAVLVVVGFLLPMVRLGTRHICVTRKPCNNNLTQIIKACMTYQEPNGGYLPAYDNGDGKMNHPMQSLALLYPDYIDDTRAFQCPSTEDTPEIQTRMIGGRKYTSFGKFDPAKIHPDTFSGREVATPYKSSYLYDGRTAPNKIDSTHAVAADADGFVWRLKDGSSPQYPATWTRKPRQPNHAGGQNVMYFDGHVKWVDGSCVSDNPKDNIYTPNPKWSADTDSFVWDGVNVPK
jgi:prepilin-type processing-associated H-X9-DG protein